MNIKTITEKIPKEAGLNPREYTVPDMLVDIHQVRLELDDMAEKSGSYNNVQVLQTEVVGTAGDITISRDLKHREIKSIKHRHNSDDVYRDILRLDERLDYSSMMRFSYDINNVVVHNCLVGDVQIEYEKQGIVAFEEDDITADPIPSPDELKEVHHKLLWLIPAYNRAKEGEKTRLKNQLDPAMQAYEDTLDREVEYGGFIASAEQDDWGTNSKFHNTGISNKL